jgi:hypothetical protein
MVDQARLLARAAGIMLIKSPKPLASFPIDHSRSQSHSPSRHRSVHFLHPVVPTGSKWPSHTSHSRISLLPIERRSRSERYLNSHAGIDFRVVLNAIYSLFIGKLVVVLKLLWLRKWGCFPPCRIRDVSRGWEGDCSSSSYLRISHSWNSHTPSGSRSPVLRTSTSPPQSNLEPSFLRARLGREPAILALRTELFGYGSRRVG